MRAFYLLIFLFVIHDFSIFSAEFYDLGRIEKSFEVIDVNDFRYNYEEEGLGFNNPFDVSLENFTSEQKFLSKFCHSDYLLLAFEKISEPFPIANTPVFKPEFFYKEPFLFYVDENLNGISFRKLEINKLNKNFEMSNTKFIENLFQTISKNSLIRFFSPKNQSYIVCFINNNVYKIRLDEEEPKLLNQAYQINEINLTQITDLIIIDSCFLFLNESKSLSFYCESDAESSEINLIQVIDHKYLNLSGELNITSMYYDDTTNTLVFSDYLNGVYMFSFDKNNKLRIKLRLNYAKVLQLDYRGSSLIIIKELFKKNICSIVLQEYLEKFGEFLFNREIYLSSLPKFQNLVRTSDFLAIVEPNLIHLYRTSINVNFNDLVDKEIYQEFNAENLLQINPMSIATPFDNFYETFILGIYKDHLQIFSAQINSINLICSLDHIEHVDEIDGNYNFSLSYDMVIRFLNCPEKNANNDYTFSSYCQKTIGLTIKLINTQNAIGFLGKLKSDKNYQLIFSVIVGTFAGVVLAILVGICLKRKYKSLQNSYKTMENQISRMDLMTKTEKPPSSGHIL